MSNEINDALERHTARIMSLPNVVSVGIGEKDGRPVVLVGVTEKVPAAELAPEDRIPDTLEGHEVDVQPLGVPEIELPEEGGHG